MAQRLFILFAPLSTGAHAQWLNYPTPGMPRTRDGKPNLAAPAPRAANGKPDLSGVWHVQPTPLAEMERLFGADIGVAEVPGMEIDTVIQVRPQYSRWTSSPKKRRCGPKALEILRQRGPGDSPSDNCLPVGIPAAGLVSEPNKIVQSPRLIVIIFESDGTLRQIYTDGRALPKEFDLPAWLGYSVGKWERDTLVVETAGFNDKSWLDLMGHPHSEALRIAERYHRRDFGHLDVEMTFDDPQMYTKPFTIKVPYEPAGRL